MGFQQNIDRRFIDEHQPSSPAVYYQSTTFNCDEFDKASANLAEWAICAELLRSSHNITSMAAEMNGTAQNESESVLDCGGAAYHTVVNHAALKRYDPSLLLPTTYLLMKLRF